MIFRTHHQRDSITDLLLSENVQSLKSATLLIARVYQLYSNPYGYTHQLGLILYVTKISSLEIENFGLK